LLLFTIRTRRGLGNEGKNKSSKMLKHEREQERLDGRPGNFPYKSDGPEIGTEKRENKKRLQGDNMRVKRVLEAGGASLM